jgi:hypothetical protein
MPTVLLIARRTLTYNGIRRVPGESFPAHSQDAGLLITLGRAINAADAEAEDGTRRRYQRRDMQPEP